MTDNREALATEAVACAIGLCGALEYIAGPYLEAKLYYDEWELFCQRVLREHLGQSPGGNVETTIELTTEQQNEMRSLDKKAQRAFSYVAERYAKIAYYAVQAEYAAQDLDRKDLADCFAAVSDFATSYCVMCNRPADVFNKNLTEFEAWISSYKPGDVWRPRLTPFFESKAPDVLVKALAASHHFRTLIGALAKTDEPSNALAADGGDAAPDKVHNGGGAPGALKPTEKGKLSEAQTPALPPMETEILLAVEQAPTGMLVTEVCSKLGKNKSTVSPAVGRLLKKGILIRETKRSPLFPGPNAKAVLQRLEDMGALEPVDETKVEQALELLGQAAGVSDDDARRARETNAKAVKADLSAALEQGLGS